jgi:hypothetical protein
MIVESRNTYFNDTHARTFKFYKTWLSKLSLLIFYLVFLQICLRLFGVVVREEDLVICHRSGKDGMFIVSISFDKIQIL